jgi:hypothetical protein
MLLFSPSESTFSCVFALTFTTLSSHPSILHKLALIKGLCGDILGRSAMIVQSMFPIS